MSTPSDGLEKVVILQRYSHPFDSGQGTKAFYSYLRSAAMFAVPRLLGERRK